MSADHPLISVIMGFYGSPEFLKAAVESVIDQTYRNWELVIVDDCDPRNSAKDILATICDERINIHRHEQNQGCPASRNTAIRLSKGAFIVPLDCDDLLAPEYIASTYKALKEAGSQAAYTDVQIFGLHEQIYKPQADPAAILSGKYPHNTFLFKRELFDAVGGYVVDSPIDDTDFWMSVLAQGATFAYVPQALYRYRRRIGSLSRQTMREIGPAYFQFLIKHRNSFADHLEEVLDIWSDSPPQRIDGLAEAQRTEYRKLHAEFHQLLSQYEMVEKKHAKNAATLASVPKLCRQIANVFLKKAGLRK